MLQELITIAALGSVNILKYRLSPPINDDPSKTTSEGENALHVAASEGKAAAVKIILEYKGPHPVDINAKVPVRLYIARLYFDIKIRYLAILQCSVPGTRLSTLPVCMGTRMPLCLWSRLGPMYIKSTR
jgi:hypothetical protein